MTLLDSLRLLGDAMASFSAHCIEGLTMNAAAHGRVVAAVADAGHRARAAHSATTARR